MMVLIFFILRVWYSRTPPFNCLQNPVGFLILLVRNAARCSPSLKTRSVAAIKQYYSSCCAPGSYGFKGGNVPRLASAVSPLGLVLSNLWEYPGLEGSVRRHVRIIFEALLQISSSFFFQFYITFRVVLVQSANRVEVLTLFKSLGLNWSLTAALQFVPSCGSFAAEAVYLKSCQRSSLRNFPDCLKSCKEVQKWSFEGKGKKRIRTIGYDRFLFSIVRCSKVP